MPKLQDSIRDRIQIRALGRQPYLDIWQSMQTFTNARTPDTVDEFWCLEHLPVFTQGQAGKSEHILNPGTIPIVQTDRGGQVTYHGPGQAIIYLLCDIRRKNLSISSFISLIETAVLDFLSDYHIPGETRANAPGVYIQGAKICSLGLRIRKGASFHGLSFNVDMDLSPFQGINPCGLQNLKVVQLRDFLGEISLKKVHNELVQKLCWRMNYEF